MRAHSARGACSTPARGRARVRPVIARKEDHDDCGLAGLAVVATVLRAARAGAVAGAESLKGGILAERKPFLLRLDPAVHDALQRWAADELRSLNAQIEFVLRRALQHSGRLKPANVSPPDSAASAEEAPTATNDK